MRALAETVSGAPGPFLRIRLLALYLLSTAAVLGAAVAWHPEFFASPFAAAGASVLLGAAALAGAAFHERFAWIAERAGRGRLRAVGGTFHAGVLVVALSGILVRQRDLLDAALRWLAWMQPLFLLLAGFGRAHFGAVLNAGALTALAAFAGGPAAAVAVASHVALLTLFLTADHVARKLAEYPVEDAPPASLAVREAALPGLGAALALALLFAWIPPQAYEAQRLRPAGGGALDPDLVGRIVFQAAAIAFLGAVGFYLLLRWGSGAGAAAGPQEDVERLRARRRSESPPAPDPLLPELPAEGPRGRVVRAYLQVLAFLGRRGVRRRRAETPSEFAPRLGPGEAGGELTALFLRARYGGEEPGEEEAGRAERAARSLQEGESPR